MTAASLPDDCDALCLRTTDRQAILDALAAACQEEDLVRAPPLRLSGYGHFVNGEEDPTLRRFLVSPPTENGWTVVLLSAQDWDHRFVPSLLHHLPVKAAYLMLHDGDTCTLHAYDGPELLAALVTSPVHFDLPDMPRDERLPSALSALAGRPVSAEEAERCCFPPGRIDIDGRLAHERIRELLGLPEWTCGTYGRALEDDGRTPAESHADWIHACFQDAEEARADEAFEAEMAAGEALPARSIGEALAEAEAETGSEARGEAEGIADAGVEAADEAGSGQRGTLLPFRRPPAP